MLQLFNTLTGRVEEFTPALPGHVKMFTCGPSVYRRPHIGNYRTFLYEDVLQRYLEYLGFEVVRLMALTDIEDKSIVEAEKEGVSVKELAERNEKIFFEDYELLKMRTPSISACMIACSSTAVQETTKLISKLLEKGVAYYSKHKGRRNVYFQPSKFPGFGKLAKINVNNWPKKPKRFHRDTYPGVQWNRGDFILWHGFKEGDLDSWETPIGKGRPSWNIQDAAAITKYLGLKIDMACGGIDNLARHHDYTIAIVESVSSEQLARYWLHGEHLFVDGKKMSKSRDNVYYPQDLVERGYTGSNIRFFLIYGHYRKKLNFTFKKMKNVVQKQTSFKHLINRLKETKSRFSSKKARRLVEQIPKDFEECMNSDLNVKAAFDALYKTLVKLDNLREKGKLSSKDTSKALDNLRKVDYVLQIGLDV